MKKTIIFIVLLVILAGVSPIIGNKIVTYYVDQEIIAVKEKGITLNFKSEVPGYLYTSKQYEFILSDVDAFAKYLTEYGAGMLPPYTDELLKSIVFRLDMKYHNIPFLKPISIDIYPMYISDDMMGKLKAGDNIFFKNFQNFITRQGLLYHIDYHLFSENYKGHIKNIDYKDRSFDGSNVILTLHNAVFNGTGSFKAPESLKIDIDKIMFKTNDKSKDVTLEIKNFSSESTNSVSDAAEELYNKSKDMYNKSNIPDHVEDIKEKSEDAARDMYNTSMKMQSMFFNTKYKDKDEETSVEAKNVDVNVSTEEGKKKSKNRSYFFFESLNLKSNKSDIQMSNVVYDSSMSGLDRQSFNALKSSLTKTRTSPSFDSIDTMKISAINLLSHGLELRIPELSVSNVHYQGEDLGGLKLISALNVKEDKNLAAKMVFSPLFIVQNLDFKVHLTISKKIYAKFIEEVPFALLALATTKETATDFIYDVSYINGDFKVNGSSVL